MSRDDDMMHRDVICQIPIGSPGAVFAIKSHWQINFRDFVFDGTAPRGAREPGRPRDRDVFRLSNKARHDRFPRAVPRRPT